MRKKFASEFKRDVDTVARVGDVTLAEDASDLNGSAESVRLWTRQAEIDDSVRDDFWSI